MPNEIAAALIASVIGGLLVAAANYLFSRRKTEAEIEKLKAETGQIEADTKKTKAEIASLKDAFEEVSCRLPQTEEEIIYDSKDGIIGFDFEIEGEHDFKDGALVIDQSGEFYVHLRKYMADGRLMKFLPRRPYSRGNRRLRVGCEAKVDHGSFSFALLFKDHDGSRGVLIGKLAKVDDAKWTKIDWFFEVPSETDFLLMIAHPTPLMQYLAGLEEEPEISLNDSKLSIRDLVLAEHISKASPGSPEEDEQEQQRAHLEAPPASAGGADTQRATRGGSEGVQLRGRLSDVSA